MKWIFLIIAAGIILFAGASFLIKPEVVETTSTSTQSSVFSSEEPIRIILAGDIMLDRGVEYMIEKYGGGNFEFPFLKIADEFKKADIVFGNLEGPISDKGIKVGSVYSFRADPRAIDGLNFAGFNALSLANNHAFDYGREALEDTLKRLKETGINYVGAGFNATETYSAVIKEIKGVKIAFLAYTDLGPETWKAKGDNSGIAWISEKPSTRAELGAGPVPHRNEVSGAGDFEKIEIDIQNAKSQADILIVSLHAGEEYQKEPTQFQTDFAKMAIDAGADIVVGHHPHVVQPNEIYNEKYIFYSLGNFVFDQGFSKETMQGKMVKVIIKNKKIEEITPIDIKINELFQPEIK